MGAELLGYELRLTWLNYVEKTPRTLIEVLSQ